MLLLNHAFLNASGPAYAEPAWGKRKNQLYFNTVEYAVVSGYYYATSAGQGGFIFSELTGKQTLELKIPGNWIKLIGVYATHDQLKNDEIIGELIVNINGRRSTPAKIPVRNTPAEQFTRKFNFWPLDEPLIPGTRIEGEFRNETVVNENPANIIHVIKVNMYLKAIASHKVN